MSRSEVASDGELAEYYETHSTAAELESSGALDTEHVEAPMVTLSIRLPQTFVKDLRAIASRDGRKVTALMRNWLEARAKSEGVEVPSSPTTTIDVPQDEPSRHADTLRAIKRNLTLAA